MSDGEPFSLELVKQFLLVRGGKVTNHELVKHFKAYLNDPVNKADVRIKFKDYVNTLASVREEEGTKFLILKKEYYTDLHGQRCELLPTPNASDDLYYDSNLSQPFSDPPVDYDVPPEARASCKADWMSPSPEQMAVADECPQSVAYMPQFTNRSVHETSVDCENVPPPLPKKKHSIESSVKWPDGPHPPPRGRKNHGRRGSQVEQRVRQFSAEKELGLHSSVAHAERSRQLFHGQVWTVSTLWHVDSGVRVEYIYWESRCLVVGLMSIVMTAIISDRSVNGSMDKVILTVTGPSH